MDTDKNPKRLGEDNGQNAGQGGDARQGQAALSRGASRAAAPNSAEFRTSPRERPGGGKWPALWAHREGHCSNDPSQHTRSRTLVTVRILEQTTSPVTLLHDSSSGSKASQKDIDPHCWYQCNRVIYPERHKTIHNKILENTEKTNQHLKGQRPKTSDSDAAQTGLSRQGIYNHY